MSVILLAELFFTWEAPLFSTDCFQFYASDYQELAKVLEFVESAVAGFHEDLAAIDGIVQRIVGVVLKIELLAQRGQGMASELRPYPT